MTLYIPVWLYWYGGMPLAFVVGYLLGWTRKREVPPDPYRDEHPGRAPGGGYRPLPPGCPSVASRSTVEAPTTKRARPIDGARDEGES